MAVLPEMATDRPNASDSAPSDAVSLFVSSTDVALASVTLLSKSAGARYVIGCKITPLKHD